MAFDSRPSPAAHTVAVVVPVYRGEHTLPPLLEELASLTSPQTSPGGASFRVSEVVLVHDSGPDRSDVIIRELARAHDFVRPVWLARNFGTHAATLAGMANTTADWIVTMDEDGQHDPQAIGSMLDAALATRSELVYALPTNRPFHSRFRNFTSRVAHWVARVISGGDLRHFHSFRFMLGDIGRDVAARCGESVYLDVALTWFVGRSASVPVAMRKERERPSGFSTRRLIAHFWRMVLTSGTRPLRLITVFGALLALTALGLIVWIVVEKIAGNVPVKGWASLTVILLVTNGAALLSLGILAEYLGVTAKAAMGKPLYVIVSDPELGPIGRTAASVEAGDPPTAERQSDVTASVRA
jgi:glycosyltransferase involved in cell wall biosynthesis